MASVRPAAVAGSFYPAAAEELSVVLDDCFESSPMGPRGAAKRNSSIIAGLVPHAGLIYSGPCAAHFYAQLEPCIERVIVLGVNHRGLGSRAALSPWVCWQTPLGEVIIDTRFNDVLETRVKFLERNTLAHAEEHSIEIQLPFLKRALQRFELVPIALSRLSIEECAELGTAIAEACQTRAQANSKTLVLASSDLSHYVSPRRTDELDRLALQPILDLNPENLLRIVEEENITMCGVLPTAVMLFAAKSLRAARAKLLKHCHSGAVVPMRKVVGYASVAIEQ